MHLLRRRQQQKTKSHDETMDPFHPPVRNNVIHC